MAGKHTLPFVRGTAQLHGKGCGYWEEWEFEPIANAL